MSYFPTSNSTNNFISMKFLQKYCLASDYFGCSGAPGFKITANQRQTGKKNYENFAPAIIAWLDVSVVWKFMKA